MNITVTAHRWGGGWEIHRDGEPITQVTTLAKATAQVRDYLDTETPDIDHSDWNVTVVPEIGELGREVAAARAATEAASSAAISAAAESRSAVRHLRQAGYSVTDSAILLGVSRGRVSQLECRDRREPRGRLLAVPTPPLPEDAPPTTLGRDPPRGPICHRIPNISGLVG